MKRIYPVIIAVIIAAAFVCTGCFGKNNNNGGKTPADQPGNVTAAPENTPHTADGDYDNSVAVNEGRVEGSSFNWLYFKGKSGAGRPAQITINSTVGGVTESMLLSGGMDGFILNRASGELKYKYLLTFTCDFAEGATVNSVEISVLTDDPELSAEDFFGGPVPENARIGDMTDRGVVVFTDYR